MSILMQSVIQLYWCVFAQILKNQLDSISTISQNIEQGDQLFRVQSFDSHKWNFQNDGL